MFSFGSLESNERTADPFADVQRNVANKISEVIATTHIPIKIIQAQPDGTLILNYGNVFFAPGDELRVMKLADTFTDPDTGEMLGSEETEIGRIRVTEAEPRFSKTTFVGNPVSDTQGVVLKCPLVPVEPEESPKKRKRSARKLFR